MADTVELKHAPPSPETGKETLPEAKETLQGDVPTITVNTDQKPPEPKQPADRPAWLPEGFESPEQLAEAWRKAQGTPDQKTDEAPAPLTQERVEKAVQDAKLDMAALTQEYADNGGKLSEDSIKKLEATGVTRDQLDAYVKGQEAQAQLLTQRMNEAVGGEENLKATLEWAAKALSETEVAAANKALASGDEAQMKLVLTGLNHRRLAEVGQEPNLVVAKAGSQRGDVKGYASTAEWISDINSAKYRSDPAFREKVARRLAASEGI